MADVWTKLNLKDHTEILLLDAPSSFELAVASLSGVRFTRKLSSARSISFLLAFVTKRLEIARLAEALTAKGPGDVVAWFAYPKGSSRRYACDFNRDSGWEPLETVGFKGVRQVAIDEDWTALRFRRVEYIKTTSRDRK